MQLPLRVLPATDRACDVVGLGQNSVDLVARVRAFPIPNSKQPLLGLDRMPGGQIASALVCCARLGFRARYIGTFGSDEFGAIGRASLVAEDVDIAAAPIVEGARTRTAIVLVDESSGDRTVLWDRDPRLAIEPATVAAGAIEGGRILLVDAEDPAAAAAAAARARVAGLVTVVDVEVPAPGVDEILRQIDVIIVSEGFPEQLTGYADPGRALEGLFAAYRPAAACVTLGAGGCLARSEAGELHVPAYPIACVDSTGAGDAFRGGFIAALLSNGAGAPLDDLLDYANAVAALNCRAAGARAGLPSPPDVDALRRAGRQGRAIRRADEM